MDYAKPAGYVDVDGDGFVAATDAIAIINRINAHQDGGEGEAVANDSYFADLGAFGIAPAPAAATAPAPADSMNDLIALLASDSVAEQARRRRG